MADEDRKPRGRGSGGGSGSGAGGGGGGGGNMWDTGKHPRHGSDSGSSTHRTGSDGIDDDAEGGSDYVEEGGAGAKSTTGKAKPVSKGTEEGKNGHGDTTRDLPSVMRTVRPG